MDYKLIDVSIHGDERGKLGVVESLKDLPFEIKRMYFIYDTLSEQERGHHSHKNMQQVIIAINGNCEIELDDGYDKENIKLDRPEKALYIGKNIWRVMKNFSKNCKLVVLASDYYDEREYVRDYDEFLRGIE